MEAASAVAASGTPRGAGGGLGPSALTLQTWKLAAGLGGEAEVAAARGRIRVAARGRCNAREGRPGPGTK